MKKVSILYNKSYTDTPDRFPKQKKRLELLREKVAHRGDRQVHMKGLEFAPGESRNLNTHVEKQLVSDLRALTSHKVVAFFGDGGAGVVLGAIDRIARQHKEKTGDDLPELTQNPICLAPGGTYIHGAKAFGTSGVDDVQTYAHDESAFTSQLVKIRKCRVVKHAAEDPGQMIHEEERPFYAFAGMFFDAYILEMNERLGRKDGRTSNALKVLYEALKDVFGGDIFGAGAPGRKPKSKLRAFTTLARWGFAKFDPEVESLGEDHLSMMESDDAGPLDMLKISAAVNIIGSNRTLLRSLFSQIEKEKTEGGQHDRMSLKSILGKFRPRPVNNFSEEFDPSFLGGTHYSTDGYPHRVNLEPGQKARLEISTIPGSGVHVARRKS